MKWISRFPLIASVVGVFGIGIASAQTTSLPVSRNGDVEFTQPVSIGATVLQPGHYRFRHTMTDGQHSLVISRQRTAMSGPVSAGTNQHYGAGKGVEVTRVPCQVVQVDRKLTRTEMYIRTQADGSRVLTQIRIRGEGVGHLLALEPQP